MQFLLKNINLYRIIINSTVRNAATAIYTAFLKIDIIFTDKIIAII